MKPKFIILLCVGAFFLSQSANSQTMVSGNKRLDEAYQLAIETVKGNTTQEGILKAGARYNGEWTRDISINIWNGVSFLNPSLAKTSLWHVTNNRNTIGAEYWDKIIWVKGAYTYYLTTHDTEFLKQAFACGYNTIKEQEASVQDANYGLFTGPSVFNDGIAGYEAPIYVGDHLKGAVVSHPGHKFIKCLSTNCIYYEGYVNLAKMARLLDEKTKAAELEVKAKALKASIRKHLFDKEKMWLNYLVDQNGDVHPHQEGLGVSFAILFEVVTPKEARKILEKIHIEPHGLPSVYPHFKRFSDAHPGRHNVLIWPFVNAFFADACIKVGKTDAFAFELVNLADLAIDKGKRSYYEIYNPITGKPDGGWQTGDYWGDFLHHQTWSATGFLNMIYYGVAGMQLEADKLVFKPFLPEGINTLELTDLQYADATLTVLLKGKGQKIKEFRVNGVKSSSFEISDKASGTQYIEIIMEPK